MKKILLLVTVFALTAFTVSAQPWAKEKLSKSPRHGEWVKVKNGDREVDCFVTYPEVKDKATAVIVIHEIFGLTDWVRGVTDQLAEAGYIAIAPDLLSGKGSSTEELVKKGEDVGKAIRGLPNDQITGDLNAVADYVTGLPSCNGKLAVAGFCWGGGQSFRYATNNKKLKAALVFYGPAPESKSDLEKISCPVYGFYGENDNRINAGIPKATEQMKEAGKTYDPKIYHEAGHGFMRAGEDPAGNKANKDARDEGWKRVKDVLKKI